MARIQCEDPPTAEPLRSAPPPADRDPPLGAHRVTPRLGYAHHGICVGDGRVVRAALGTGVTAFGAGRS